MESKGAKCGDLFGPDCVGISAPSSEHWKMNAWAQLEEEHLLR